ncbi:hypothetical protein KC19_VG224000 [Ceratodon purpureus]|uniref:Uncharacterized protein n=1 Tax=Ceratodon purpureus TaxID=3225 RepID=A0A8T0HT19_CERPU|nr:hypothetical protein KC19_VG224000 [Ceratodon purpureus]
MSLSATLAGCPIGRRPLGLRIGISIQVAYIKQLHRVKLQSKSVNGERFSVTSNRVSVSLLRHGESDEVPECRPSWIFGS